jgi:hypothetical protein
MLLATASWVTRFCLGDLVIVGESVESMDLSIPRRTLAPPCLRDSRSTLLASCRIVLWRLVAFFGLRGFAMLPFRWRFWFIMRSSSSSRTPTSSLETMLEPAKAASASMPAESSSAAAASPLMLPVELCRPRFARLLLLFAAIISLNFFNRSPSFSQCTCGTSSCWIFGTNSWHLAA